MLHGLLRTAAATAVDRWLFAPGQSLHAPHLLDLEVAQVLRRHASSGGLDADRCRAALSAMAEFPLTRHPHHLLLPRIWQLRHNLSAYDAAYVALAEVLDAPLLTADRRIATAPGHRARVELV